MRLCQWIDVATDEARAHLVSALAPDGWMELGPGDGLRVAVTGQPAGSRLGEPTHVIATQHDVTVAALTAANPGVSLVALTAGQVIIIPRH